MANDPLALLHHLYQQALGAVSPLDCLPAALPPAPHGKTVVVGMGKAAAAMAHAVELHWKGALQGVVAVPKGATRPLQIIQQIEASHPVPDASSFAQHRP